MPYATRDFLADPMNFMENNIIVPYGIGATQASARIQELCLCTKDYSVGRRNGRNVNIWRLRKSAAADPFGESFFAYWCPYLPNATLSCSLGNGARFMFTATMNGCTFGVGTQNTGNCRVAHSNMGSHGGNLSNIAGLSIAQAREEQRKTQRNAIHFALGTYENVSAIINPADYMVDDNGERTLWSTTFGTHEMGKQWSFYTQRYLKTGETYLLRDVTQQV